MKREEEDEQKYKTVEEEDERMEGQKERKMEAKKD